MKDMSVFFSALMVLTTILPSHRLTAPPCGQISELQLIHAETQLQTKKKCFITSRLLKATVFYSNEPH